VARIREQRRKERTRDQADALEITLRVVGHRVAELRRAAAWTQAKLAERANCSAKHLQEIELGQTNCTIGSLTDIAVALKRPVHEIFEALRPEEPPLEPYAGRAQSRTVAYLVAADSKIPEPRRGRPASARGDTSTDGYQRRRAHERPRRTDEDER
jgi:transcriptional regulator with XRE-family HTH domain